MTNKELNEKFREITLMNDNVFDRYCQVIKLEGEYETTPFAEQTDKDVEEAYALYIKEQGLLDTLLSMFTNPDLDLNVLQSNLTQLGGIITGMKLDAPSDLKDIMTQLLKN